MTVDEQLHYLGGFAKALPYRLFSKNIRAARVREIDLWAFDREWNQNQAGLDPNVVLSRHQLDEAIAWGKGARACLRVWPVYPSCYDTGHPD